VEEYRLETIDSKKLYARLLIRLLALALAIIAVYFGLPLVLNLLMPFVLAFVVAWTLNPLSNWLRKKTRIPRKVLASILILLAYIIIGGLITLGIRFLVGEISSLSANWSELFASFQAVFESIFERVDRFLYGIPVGSDEALGQTFDQILTWINDSGASMLAGLVSFISGYAAKAPSFIISSFFFIIASYLITISYPNIRGSIHKYTPEILRGPIKLIMDTAKASLGGYLKAQLILAAVVFAIVLAGFLILGTPYAILLALLLAFIDFLPVVGAPVVLLPWALISLIISDYRNAAGMLIIYAVIFIARRLLEPKVIGDQTGLSMLWTMVGMYAGMKLWGVVGMIFGPILLMIIFNIVRTGVFDNTVTDINMLVAHFQDILADRKKKPRPPRNKTGDNI